MLRQTRKRMEERVSRENEVDGAISSGNTGDSHRAGFTSEARWPSFRAWLTLLLACVVTIVLHGLWGGDGNRPARRRQAVPAGVVSSVELEVAPKPESDLADHSRQRWGAAPVSAHVDSLGRPRRVTVHHFGDKNVESSVAEKTARLLRGIQHDHQKVRRWADIGYHLILDRAGVMWEGRPLCSVGAHAGPDGANEGNIGVLVLGNFDQQQLTLAQEGRLKSCLDTLRERYDIEIGEVLTHAEVREERGLSATACPGRRLARWVKEYRQKSSRRTVIVAPARSSD